MWEKSYSKRMLRAELVGRVVRWLCLQSVTKVRTTSWRMQHEFKNAHYRLMVSLEHNGKETTQLEVINGDRYGNDFLLDELIAALGDRKGSRFHKQPGELITVFNDPHYRLFD